MIRRCRLGWPEPGPHRGAGLAAAGRLARGRAAAGPWTTPEPEPDSEDADERPGFLGRLFNRRPRLPDRSRSLRGETGGRFDKLDLLIMIVLLVGLLTLRIFRLSDPYEFHFDEVYHARTAMEFLQGWRYGIPHDIYEWTHPHLAKYAMAEGIELPGRQQGHGHRPARRVGQARSSSSRAGTTRACPTTGPATASTSRAATRSGSTTSRRVT